MTTKRQRAAQAASEILSMPPRAVPAPGAGMEDLPPRRKIKTEVLGVRLDEFSAAALEKVAARIGVGASTLARMWILEKLAPELPPDGPEALVRPSEG